MDFSVGWNHESWSWDTKSLIMARVLRRPMFRLGGNTDQGIMSGVAPRQGYDNGKRVWDMTPKELGENATIGEMYEAAGMAQPKTQPRSSGDLSRFLIDFGLDIASATPSGSIFSTAAQSAKAPFERYQKAKAERAQSEAERAQSAAESQADLFGQLFKGATGRDEKGFAHRDRAAMVRENMDKQFNVYDQLSALDKEAPDYIDQREKLLRSLRTLKEEVSSDEFAEAQLKYWNEDRNSRKLDGWIVRELEKKFGVPLDLEGNVDHINSFNQRREEIMNDIKLGMSPTFNFATGGRVGYKAAGSMMGDAIQSTPAMPEELGDISYEELRSRLPQEVSDEIVRLLASSAEALEDFAIIQTEQDIANFNKKYGVNLVLPSEG